MKKDIFYFYWLICTDKLRYSISSNETSSIHKRRQYLKRLTILFVLILAYWLLFKPQILSSIDDNVKPEAVYSTLLTNNSTFSQLSNTTHQFLQVTPEECVVNNRNDTCKKLISFRWAIKNRGTYCLYIENSTQALQCWNNANKGVYNYKFNSAKSQTYRLREKNSQKEITHIHVTVAWIYGNYHQNNKHWRSDWRLF